MLLSWTLNVGDRPDAARYGQIHHLAQSWGFAAGMTSATNFKFPANLPKFGPWRPGQES